ncbi:hypothetical protein [Pseudoalteromonas rubra]|uniref:hypothetical protein n=1 Tax=Pseudoalteromonas rubra TaxID=43658 RepID=UPI002DBE2BDB|nr:hypothetical protein [Pseudoalteromonas rubra]MEC4090826.1 hypothetical protein [Pseudoalteromonas rubra]
MKFALLPNLFDLNSAELNALHEYYITKKFLYHGEPLRKWWLDEMDTKVAKVDQVHQICPETQKLITKLNKNYFPECFSSKVMQLWASSVIFIPPDNGQNICSVNFHRDNDIVDFITGEHFSFSLALSPLEAYLSDNLMSKFNAFDNICLDSATLNQTKRIEIKQGQSLIVNREVFKGFGKNTTNQHQVLLNFYVRGIDSEVLMQKNSYGLTNRITNFSISPIL